MTAKNAWTPEPHYSNEKAVADACAQDEAKYRARAAACFKALAGIPDPAAFVAQANAMREALQHVHSDIMLSEVEGGSVELAQEVDAALSSPRPAPASSTITEETVKAVRAALEGMLNCCAVNLDDQEPSDLLVYEKARSALALLPKGA